MPQLVHHFRQILLWPLQLMPIREGAQIQELGTCCCARRPTHPWREIHDEFGCAPREFQQRHYSEFVTFLPYVRRFLYGEARARAGAAATESPIRVFRRNDVAKVAADLPDAEPNRRPRRRARRPVLLLRRRRRDAGGRGLRRDLPLDARAGHHVPFRPRLPDVLGRRAAAAAIAWSASSGSAATARCWRRPTTSSRDKYLSLRRHASRATLRVALDVPAAAAGAGPFRREGLDPLPPDRVQPDAAAGVPRDGRRARS